MKLRVNDPLRGSIVGRSIIELKDCAQIQLEADEQVTFLTETGSEYDVARKSWYFYATPSLNNWLRKFGLRAVLVKGENSNFYGHIVEKIK